MYSVISGKLVLPARLFGNDYQNFSRRSQPEYETNDDRLRHAVFGLTSEAGEVAGILQKEYQGHEFDEDHLKKELGDCLWMISEACDAIGCTMEDVMRANMEKLFARYPEGFEKERSLFRRKGDI